MITRDEALVLVKKHLKNKNLRKHVLAVEALMRKLAVRLDGNPDVWGLAGLLHDLDYELTLDKPAEHTQLTIQWLKEHGGVSEEILNTIRAHVGTTPRTTTMEQAIYCSDPTSGFLVACALMHPEKRLAAVDLDFIKNRFKEKRFAAGADREQMKSCAELGLELDEFLLLAREAMVEISDELGL